MTDVADATPNTHTFFVDEGEVKDFDLAKRLDTHPKLINRKSNRPRMADLAKMELPIINKEVGRVHLLQIILNLASTVK